MSDICCACTGVAVARVLDGTFRKPVCVSHRRLYADAIRLPGRRRADTAAGRVVQRSVQGDRAEQGHVAAVEAGGGEVSSAETANCNWPVCHGSPNPCLAWCKCRCHTKPRKAAQ